MPAGQPGSLVALEGADERGRILVFNVLVRADQRGPLVHARAEGKLDPDVDEENDSDQE